MNFYMIFLNMFNVLVIWVFLFVLKKNLNIDGAIRHLDMV